MRVLVVAGLALALVACGGSAVKPLTAAQVKHCSVRVYFASNATQAEERAVAGQLRADAAVTRITFVSKAQALVTMTKKYPALTAILKRNPLPDSYTAVPQQLSDVPAITASIVHVRGVANVKSGVKRFCSS